MPLFSPRKFTEILPGDSKFSKIWRFFRLAYKLCHCVSNFNYIYEFTTQRSGGLLTNWPKLLKGASNEALISRAIWDLDCTSLLVSTIFFLLFWQMPSWQNEVWFYLEDEIGKVSVSQLTNLRMRSLSSKLKCFLRVEIPRNGTKSWGREKSSWHLRLSSSSSLANILVRVCATKIACKLSKVLHYQK